MNNYSVGVDIHGVLDTIDYILKPIMKALVKDNISLHIITGIPFKYVKDKLDELGVVKDVHYTHFFSVEEWLIKNNIKPIRTNSKGRNEYPNKLWDRVKGDYCKKHNIGLMLDDSDVYEKYFRTPYAKLKV